MILQTAGVITVVSFWLCGIFFPVAHCVFVTAFCDDLQSEIQTLNKSLKIGGVKKKNNPIENDKKEKIPINRHKEIAEKLFKIIQFTCDAKQLRE